MRQKPIVYLLLWTFLSSCQTNPEESQGSRTPPENAVPDTLSSQPKHASSPSKPEVSLPIPKGFRIASTYPADLNYDAKEDQLVILEVDHSLDSTTLSSLFPETFDLATTPLLIFIRQADGAWKEMAWNNEVIYDGAFQEATGNGFSEIRLEKGSFTVEYFYHMSTHHHTESYTFQYNLQQKDWLLKEYHQIITSDTPVESGGYDDTQEVTKSAKDFGQISFTNFKTNDVQ